MQHNKYSAENNMFESRDKREVGSCSMGVKSTCILYMRSDPTLFNKFKGDLNVGTNLALASQTPCFSWQISMYSAVARVSLNKLLQHMTVSPHCGTIIVAYVQPTLLIMLRRILIYIQFKLMYCSRNIDAYILVLIMQLKY